MNFTRIARLLAGFTLFFALVQLVPLAVAFLQQDDVRIGRAVQPELGDRGLGAPTPSVPADGPIS